MKMNTNLMKMNMLMIKILPLFRTHMKYIHFIMLKNSISLNNYKMRTNPRGPFNNKNKS